MDVPLEIRLIQKELDRLNSLEEAGSDPAYLTPTKPLIQRATQILRANNDFELYFQPVSVAFGPLHHPSDDDPNSRLHRAEKSKLQLAAKFIKHSGGTKENFYNNVKKHLSSLKKCYVQKEQDKWKWDDKDLAWMFLVDGRAVLYLMYLDANNKWEKVGCKNTDLAAFAKLDLFLLENQLPFQLLQLLMSLCTIVPSRELDGKDGGDDSSHTDEGKTPAKVLMDSVKRFINLNAMSLEPQQISIFISDDHDFDSQTQQYQPQQQQRQEEPAHLLELLRRELIGVILRNQGEKQQQVNKSDGFWGP